MRPQTLNWGELSGRMVPMPGVKPVKPVKPVNPSNMVPLRPDMHDHAGHLAHLPVPEGPRDAQVINRHQMVPILARFDV